MRPDQRGVSQRQVRHSQLRVLLLLECRIVHTIGLLKSLSGGQSLLCVTGRLLSVGRLAVEGIDQAHSVQHHNIIGVGGQNLVAVFGGPGQIALRLISLKVDQVYLGGLVLLHFRVDLEKGFEIGDLLRSIGDARQNLEKRPYGIIVAVLGEFRVVFLHLRPFLIRSLGGTRGRADFGLHLVRNLVDDIENGIVQLSAAGIRAHEGEIEIQIHIICRQILFPVFNGLVVVLQLQFHRRVVLIRAVHEL